MMRHPFHGVVVPEGQSPAADDPRGVSNAVSNAVATVSSGRRMFFGQALAGLFGFGSLLVFGRSAAGQAAADRGRGGRSSFDAGYGGRSGGSFRGGLGGTALDGTGSRPRAPVTTYALGEEGTGGGGRVTTYALGEEGSYTRPPRYYYNRPRYWRSPYYYHTPRYTTFALGEEG